MDESGLLVIDKPGGMTSQQVVGRVRRACGTRKVGHAGTLDPMATGVLIVGVNRATRLLGHLALHDKAYSATVRLGQSTDSDDADGEITAEADASTIDRERLLAAMAHQTGDIQQIPTTISAIKVDGKRAYARARAGEDVVLKARPVAVSRFDLIAMRPGDGITDIDVEVECSSGTYVRALARDIGAELGVGGHLTALRRTRIGKYDLSMSVPLDELGERPELMPMADGARLSFATLTVDEQQADDVRHGRKLQIELGSSPTGIVAPDGSLLALYEPADDLARPLAVLVG